MLYISRHIGQAKYGVVDSDDGVETVCTYGDLHEYVIGLGLDIKGVQVTEVVSRGKLKPMIQRVDVYQDASFVTRSQAKMKVLSGVDVKTYGDQVVAINIGKGGLPKKTELRLSDYGTSCGEYIFQRMTTLTNGALVIKLDDNIALTSKSLRYCFDRGVVIDTSEVTEKKVIEYVARELSGSYHWLTKIYDNVVRDNQSRIDYYVACTVLARPSNHDPRISKIDDLVSDAVIINRVIGKRHRAEFVSVSKANLMQANNLRWANFSKQYVQFIRSMDAQSLLAGGKFAALRGSRFVEIFGALRECSTCNKNVLTRYENYIKFFEATKEVQTAFVSLCRRASDWLIELAYDEGWM